MDIKNYKATDSANGKSVQLNSVSYDLENKIMTIELGQIDENIIGPIIIEYIPNS